MDAIAADLQVYLQQSREALLRSLEQVSEYDADGR